jgi:DNA-binding transcriptional LysR family regulator
MPGSGALPTGIFEAALKYPNIDTYHLIVFFYVVNEKSITSAAEKLCLTQPTVTNHIKSLENAIGLKLLEVRRKRINLTPAGEGLYYYAREIYAEAIAAERYVKQLKYSRLNIGSSHLFVSLIAKAINLLTEETRSSIKVNLQFEAHEKLIQDVIDSRLDLAVVPDLGYGANRVHHIRISDGVRLVFYASPAHPLFNQESVEWADICNYPLLVGHEPFATKKIIPNKLIAEGVTTPLNMDLTADNVQCCKILVQNGKNISVALEEDIESELKEGKLKALPLPNDIWIEVDAVMHRGAVASPLVQHFLAAAKTAFAEPAGHPAISV